MDLVITPQCAYPGCDQPTAAPSNDRGAKPKYCDDDSHNPLTAHRERRNLQAEASGQRAEETGGQPVTVGLTRAAELVRKLEKLTAQHTDTLTRAVTELRSAGDLESAEAEVYATRTTADQQSPPQKPGLPKKSSAAAKPKPNGTRPAPTASRPRRRPQAITRMEELARDHAPNTMDNFCFDVTLSYRRLERPRRAR